MLIAPQGAWSVGLSDSLVTGEDGSFELPTSSEPPWRCVAIAAGYVTGEKMIEARRAGVTLALQAGGRISGTVRSRNGKPVPGATVSAVTRLNRGAWPLVETTLMLGEGGSGGQATCSEDGSFSISGLLADTRYELRAAAENHCGPDLRRPGAVAYAGDEDVKLVLDQAAVMVMRFRGDGGDVIDPETVLMSYSLPQGVVMGLPGAPDGNGVALLDSSEDEWVDVSYFRGQRGTGVMERKPLEFDIELEAAWFKPQAIKVVLPWGKRTEQVVTLHRAPKVPALRAVRVGLYSGRSRLAFTDDLVLAVRGVEGMKQVGTFGVPLSPGLFVRFRDGISIRDVLLPAAGCEVAVLYGGGADTYFLNSSSPVWCRVPARLGGDQAPLVEVRLEANPVVLTVLNEEGQAVRGFDLLVKPEGVSGVHGRGWVQAWDAQWDQAYRGYERSPTVWVSKGTALVRVEHDGYGTAQSEIFAPGDGAQMELTVVLR